MNDYDMMSKFQKKPRKEFSDALYHRISREESRAPGRLFKIRNLAYIPLALVVVFLIAFAAVPSVRAATLEFLIEVAGFTFLETSNPFEPISPDTTSTHSFLIESIVAPGEGAEPGNLIISHSGDTHEAPEISQEDLVEKYYIQFQNFQVPEGYWSEGPRFFEIDESKKGEESEWLGMQTWFNPDTKAALFLITHPEGLNMVTVIGPGSVKEVNINGRAAALYKGIWEGDQETGEAGWNASHGHTLIWSADGVTYELSSPDLDADMLIQIVESMD